MTTLKSITNLIIRVLARFLPGMNLLITGRLVTGFTYMLTLYSLLYWVVVVISFPDSFPAVIRYGLYFMGVLSWGMGIIRSRRVSGKTVSALPEHPIILALKVLWIGINLALFLFGYILFSAYILVYNFVDCPLDLFFLMERWLFLPNLPRACA